LRLVEAEVKEKTAALSSSPPQLQPHHPIPISANIRINSKHEIVKHEIRNKFKNVKHKCSKFKTKASSHGSEGEQENESFKKRHCFQNLKLKINIKRRRR
jgi:hypothetical protein